ncbi:MAG: hypothetical protein JNJ61_22790 [Anaerolineae bacterium]|nr:hypothetical protein [Anaerolineae bacterium]
MDLRDRQVDSLIEESLYISTNLAPQQKQDAWKRLRARAGQQSLLPPAAACDRPLSLLERVFGNNGFLQAWLARLAVDEARYERARQNQYSLRYGVLITSAGFPNRLVEPFRYHFMTPVF